MQILQMNAGSTKVRFGATENYRQTKIAVTSQLAALFSNNPSLTPTERQFIEVQPDSHQPAQNRVNINLYFTDWGDMSLSDKVIQVLQQNPHVKPTTKADQFLWGKTTVQILLCSQAMRDPNHII